MIALVASPVTAPFATLDLGPAHEIPLEQVLDMAGQAPHDVAKENAVLLSASSGATATMRSAPLDAPSAPCTLSQLRFGLHLHDFPDLSDPQAAFRQVLRV
jgi:hypothetical protein